MACSVPFREAGGYRLIAAYTTTAGFTLRVVPAVGCTRKGPEWYDSFRGRYRFRHTAPDTGRKCLPFVSLRMKEFGYGLFEFFDGLFDGVVRFSGGGILVAAAVEIFRGEEADVHIAARAEGDTDEPVGFDEHGRHLYRSDGERVIDESLAVPHLEVEPAHFVLLECDVCGTSAFYHAHLVEQHVTPEPYPSFAVRVVDPRIDIGNVDSFLNQTRNGPEKTGGEKAERKVARVGHDADIQRFSRLLIENVESGQFFRNPVDEVGCGTRCGVRKYQRIFLHGWVEVMVDEYPDRFPVVDDVAAEVFEPVNPVEVEEENDVGAVDCLDGFFVRFLGDDDMFDAPHPSQEAAIPVGYQRSVTEAER